MKNLKNIIIQKGLETGEAAIAAFLLKEIEKTEELKELETLLFSNQPEEVDEFGLEEISVSQQLTEIINLDDDDIIYHLIDRTGAKKSNIVTRNSNSGYIKTTRFEVFKKCVENTEKELSNSYYLAFGKTPNVVLILQKKGGDTLCR